MFVGYVAGGVTTTGTVNSFVGAYSGRYNTTGTIRPALEIAFMDILADQRIPRKRTTPSSGRILDMRLLPGIITLFWEHPQGYTNATGSGNVFLGYNAGYNETGSDKLYIDNSNTSTPLIYGDFAANRVGINVLPGSYTLNVGGALNATSVAVNGATMVSSQWASSSSNIYFSSGIVSIGASAPAGYKLAVGARWWQKKLL